jgi:hypothetical protein
MVMLNESKEQWRMVFRDIFAPPDDDVREVDTSFGSRWRDETFELEVNDMSDDQSGPTDAARWWEEECRVEADEDVVTVAEAETVEMWQSVCQRVNRETTGIETANVIRNGRAMPAYWPFALAATLLIGMAVPTFGWWSYRQMFAPTPMPSALAQRAAVVEPLAGARVEPVGATVRVGTRKAARHTPKVQSPVKKNEHIRLIMATYKSDDRQQPVSDEVMTARYDGSGLR